MSWGRRHGVPNCVQEHSSTALVLTSLSQCTASSRAHVVSWLVVCMGLLIESGVEGEVSEVRQMSLRRRAHGARRDITWSTCVM